MENNIKNFSIEVNELKEQYTFNNLRYKNILYKIQNEKGNSNYYYWLGYYHYKLKKINEKLKMCENVDLIS
jgi:hypothetical protein